MNISLVNQCTSYVNTLFQSAQDIVKVRVGSRDDQMGGQVVDVLKTVAHSKYHSFRDIDANYDYGVVILAKALMLRTTVKIAELATEELKAGTMLTLSGFGDEQYLKQMQIPIYDQEECFKAYGSIPLILNLEVGFCAGFPSGNVSSCRGDSGGPLMHGDKLLYGIVSWGDPDCGMPEFPPVFAKVSLMVNWFKAFIDEYP